MRRPVPDGYRFDRTIDESAELLVTNDFSGLFRFHEGGDDREFHLLLQIREFFIGFSG